jgi:hypothetical protein
MTKLQAGDDVIVEFDGWEHRGEVKSHRVSSQITRLWFIVRTVGQ